MHRPEKPYGGGGQSFAHEDMRYKSLRHYASEATDSCVKFFIWAYKHHAETMPHDIGGEEPLSDSDVEEIKISAAVRDASLHGDYDNIMESFLPSSQSANIIFASESPKKYLPPGGIAGLYRLYRGNCLCMNMKTSSWRTFFTVWIQEFKGTLEFRGQSQHGKCNNCEDFAQSLRNALTTAERIQIASTWDNHLKGTFADRRVYYHINDCGTRYWSGMSASENIAGFIIDGMDQAKFRCPRITFKSHVHRAI